MNESSQWPHVTRHIPGVDDGNGANPGALPVRDWPGVSGLSVKLIIRLQFCRGQAILKAEDLQMRRQLHGHLTYFFPLGASRMGVASLQFSHLTTCCSLLLEMSIRELQTLQATSFPVADATTVA